MKQKTNFCPNKIKCLLEYKGFGRITDSELAELLGVKKNTISRWKIKSPILFDKIHNSKIEFEKLIKILNNQLIFILKLNPINIYNWDKQRPLLLTKLEYFFNKTGLTFEDIYENNN